MSIIKSESISNRGHILHVLSHMSPKIWRISRSFAISQLDAVSPHIDCSSQVVESNHAKVFHAIVTHNPTVVSSFRLLIIIKL